MTTDTIPDEVRAEILRRLRAAEEEHDVRVLLAVESGSRAWGFASPDSDFDARFIYVHRRDWYVAVGLEEQRDVIEYPIVDELDVNGWDLRKALRLYWKSNPAFVEWIQSPIVYAQRGRFAERARGLLPQVYSCERGIYHYRSMAKTNYRGYLRGELVPLKKYFYVLRPLLAARWLERYGEAAPIEFAKLLTMLDEPALRADIDDLLARKRVTPELGVAPPIPRINAFVEAELERLDALRPPQWRPGEIVPTLNALFRELVAEAWDDADE
jgi:predicted nucleotidyltransferase